MASVLPRGSAKASSPRVLLGLLNHSISELVFEIHLVYLFYPSSKSIRLSLVLILYIAGHSPIQTLHPHPHSSPTQVQSTFSF